jgi:OmcA/MtrC family decaheme c-type cytochrome
MKSLRGSLVMAMTAGALLILPMSNARVTRIVTRTAGADGATDPKTVYGPHQAEYWLSADEFGYVRPGLNITVNSVSIGADGKAVVDMSFTDDLGQPLDRHGAVTAGAISTSFILAWWDPNARQYTAYTTRKQTSPITGVTATQAGTDSGGTYTDLDLGHATYTFGTAVPAGYDPTVTTTIGIYATRDLITPGVATKNYYANVEQDFVPNGAAVSQVWDVIDTNSCNKCHNPLSAHGGSRRDVKLCVLCHQPQTTDPDTGNTVDFKVMIHKIHMGANLPSVQAGTPYQIIGFQQSVNDFSTVVFPQDIRNCATCHGAANADTPPPTQSFNWYAYPGMAACQSCHDDVTFTPGGNHPGGPQANDSLCSTCHQPQGGEWDASVMGAHTVPYKSTQLKGVNAQIVSVTNTAPGQTPTIVLNLTQNDGTPIPPSAFTTQNSDGSTSSGLNVLMSGPTTDYSIPPQIRERADGATASGANYTYTFNTPIPADATGTWGFSIEARLTVTLNPAPSDTTTVRDAAFNPIFYSPVTDTAAVERRVVVDIAKCNVCHDRLALHGSNRLNPQECVFCHNPNGLDGNTPPESIDFKRMIHKIHRGENLTHDYTIGDTSFNDVRFPGDLRDCQKCHTTDANGVGTEQVSETPPPGLLATQTPKDWYTPMQHFATACLACHDTQSAAAHAVTMTTTFPGTGVVAEACATCHGPNAAFSVDQVHAR